MRFLEAKIDQLLAAAPIVIHAEVIVHTAVLCQIVCKYLLDEHTDTDSPGQAMPILLCKSKFYYKFFQILSIADCQCFLYQ